VAIVVASTCIHKGSAGDADVDTAASSRFAVAGTVVGGSSRVVEQIRDWKAGDLGSREDG
jgi:hypothetical protein